MTSYNEPMNFGAGPGKIPKEVLKEVQEEFLSYHDLEFSVTELSHRSLEYAKINQDAQEDLRELLSIPKNFKILFLHGGGQCLFSAIPMNLMGKTGSADYIISGIWSQIAANEGKKYGKVNIVFPKPEKPGEIPDKSKWKLNSNASYVYYCDNETIEGIEFPFIPDINEVPIVADMSSSIMTKRIDVSKFGIIFAAAQKNLGTAGLGIVIIREDLLGNAIEMCPSFLNFENVNKANSILNTPPIFSVYVLGKVLQWIKSHGGLEEMEQQIIRKSNLLYNALSNSSNFYQPHVLNASSRSKVNVPFRIKDGDTKLEDQFLREAEERKMYQLKGHHLVGGIRVSLYNAISYDNVLSLVNFMREFQEKNQV